MNDDYTPMEFVILVLENILVNQEEATQITICASKRYRCMWLISI